MRTNVKSTRKSIPYYLRTISLPDTIQTSPNTPIFMKEIERKSDAPDQDLAELSDEGDYVP